MARHRSFRRNTTRLVTQEPNLSLLEGVVHPKIIKAMRVASAQLRKAGVRHAVVGGLAVGAYGYPRATKDVDFLVGDEAFNHHGGGIVTIAAGVPIAVGDVAVDPLSVSPGEEYLDDAIDAAIGDVPVLGVEALIYMKLKSPRRKDSADIVELIKVGIDVESVVGYLDRYAPHMKAKFLQLVEVAELEG